jgi:hypothetical protein
VCGGHETPTRSGLTLATLDHSARRLGYHRPQGSSAVHNPADLRQEVAGEVTLFTLVASVAIGEAQQKGCGASLLRAPRSARREARRGAARGQSERREEHGGAHHGGDWDGHGRWRSVLGACVHGARTSSAACASCACSRGASLYRGEATPHHAHPVQGHEAVQGADGAVA